MKFEYGQPDLFDNIYNSRNLLMKFEPRKNGFNNISTTVEI